MGVNARHRRRHRPGRRRDAPDPRRARLPGRRDPLLRLGPLGRHGAAVRAAARSSSRTPRPPTRPGSTSRCSPPARRPRGRWRRAFAAAGVIVVDNSSAFRMDPDVPLVVSEVNPERDRRRAQGHHRQPELHDDGRDAGAQAAARRGRAGPAGRVDLPGRLRLRRRRRRGARHAGRGGRRQGARAGLRRRGGRVPRAGEVRPHRSPTTCCRWPARSSTTARTRPTRSRSSATSRARSSASPTCAVSGICVRVPVFTGHSLSINAEFARPLPVERARELLADAPGVELADIPTPLQAAGKDPSYVGRLRQDPGVDDDRGLALFVSNDNLRKGAALNTVQIAELVAARADAAGPSRQRCRSAVARPARRSVVVTQCESAKVAHATSRDRRGPSTSSNEQVDEEQQRHHGDQPDRRGSWCCPASGDAAARAAAARPTTTQRPGSPAAAGSPGLPQRRRAAARPRTAAARPRSARRSARRPRAPVTQRPRPAGQPDRAAARRLAFGCVRPCVGGSRAARRRQRRRPASAAARATGSVRSGSGSARGAVGSVGVAGSRCRLGDGLGAGWATGSAVLGAARRLRARPACLRPKPNDGELQRRAVVPGPSSAMRRVCHDRVGRPDRAAGPEGPDRGSGSMVGLTGFEPAASSSRTRRATKLRHSPIAPRSVPGPRAGDHTRAPTGARNRPERAVRPRAVSVSRVASGRQATRIRAYGEVPRPAETCSQRRARVAGPRSRPGAGAGPWPGRARGRSWWSARRRPGRHTWPPWVWPARTAS